MLMSAPPGLGWPGFIARLSDQKKDLDLNGLTTPVGVSGWMNAFSLMVRVEYQDRNHAHEDVSQQEAIRYLECCLLGRLSDVRSERHHQGSGERPNELSQRESHPEAKSGSLFTLNQVVMVYRKPNTHSSWREVGWP
jgi:hypothetical protein